MHKCSRKPPTFLKFLPTFLPTFFASKTKHNTLITSILSQFYEEKNCIKTSEVF